MKRSSNDGPLHLTKELCIHLYYFLSIVIDLFRRGGPGARWLDEHEFVGWSLDNQLTSEVRPLRCKNQRGIVRANLISTQLNSANKKEKRWKADVPPK
jgi:hypothetical protein